MDAPILAWYFASTDRKALHGGATLRAGVTECFEGELVLGHRGLHASCDPIDALILGHGPIACRVELMGELCEGDTQLCASQRTVHWLADASDLLRARAREALAQHFDADLEDEAGLRRLLEQAREEVEERFDELRDGEWKKHERGEDVDLEALRSSVETARVRSRVIDSALRLCSDRVQAIRSVYEFLRELGITPDLASGLEALPRLEKQSPPSLEAHPLDPITVRKGPLYDARDALGRELGKIGWITRAAFGVRHPDGAHVLFIETKPRRNPKPKRDARLIVERIRAHVAVDPLVVALNRTRAFQLDLRGSAVFTDGSECTSCDVAPLEQVGEVSLLAAPIAIAARNEPRAPRWKARLKDGPAIPTSSAPQDRLHHDNMVSSSPSVPVTEPTLRRSSSASSKTSVDPRGLYARGFIGVPVVPGELTRGLSVWKGMTYREACKHARAVLPMLDDPRPAVVIDGVPRPAVRLRRMPALMTLRDAATRVVSGSSYWNHETEALADEAIRKLGRTAGYPILAIEQPVPLEDEALSLRLRAIPWIRAAWFVSLTGCAGSVGIEIWRTYPEVTPTRDATEVAAMWHDLAGPARLVVVFREASPTRWVFVDEKCVATEIDPVALTSRSLCYLAS